MRNSFLLTLTLILFSARLAAQCDVVISYAGTPFCKSINTPQPVTISGAGSTAGGTFSSTAGLTINAATGAITPSSSSEGTYTVSLSIPGNPACPTPVTTSVTIVGIPTAPVVGAITQPTCNVSTGSVALSGLPSFGDWTVTATPGGATTTGNGATTTFSGLLGGVTYTFKVTNYAGCVSVASGTAVIQSQPSTPTAPLVGTVTAPTCSVATGSVVFNGLPATGTWTLKRYPGSVTTTGTGISTTISGLPSGTYNYSVANEAGCVSATLSADVVIPVQPSTPSAPVIGTITQPTCALATGSVALSGLPASGTWTVTLVPGGTTLLGSGTTALFSGIAAGTYTVTVTGSNLCTSVPSSSFVINAQPVTPSAPVVGTITQPTCAVGTGSVVLNSLPAGSWVLTRTPGAVTSSGSGTTATVSGLDPGTYSFTVTNAAGCTSASSAPVVINARPPSPGTPEFTTDCALGFGHAVITIITPVGIGLQYSLDGGAYQSSNIFSNVANGNHYLSVRNAEGCVTSTGIFTTTCGCIDAPAVLLSASADSTCGTNPVTVTGNTFSGSATSVTITENGGGSVTPSSANTSPFSFTYTPSGSDRGRIVTITVTTNNPLGTPCLAAIATFTLTVNAVPSAPVVGTITHLTCSSGSGSVVLNGLPSSGTWTLTRLPDNVVSTGTGTSTTVTGLPAGTFNFIVTSEAGCASAQSSNVVINPQPDSPTAPVIGAITNPTCNTSTGSVALSGLPATGTWTITRLPGGATRSGSGSTYLATTIPGGTYTYTVTNSSGCVSPQSEPFTINEQPATPTAPAIGTITPPTCSLATGSVELLGLPATGTWTLTRYSPAVGTTGTGSSTTVSGIPTGTYNFSVANEAGCVSSLSLNVVIPAQPATPPAPTIGTVTQPTLAVPTGSAVLNGLPASGAWIITRLPDNVTTAGSGVTFTETGLEGGLYTFTVTNILGCTSLPSAEVTISTPGKPDVIITDPPAGCNPGKVDITAASVTEGSTTGLTFTYWTDEAATQVYATPAAASPGTYYIKGTTVSGYFDIKPVVVTTVDPPVPDAGPDQFLAAENSTTLAAVTEAGDTGTWSIVSGEGIITDITSPNSPVTNLADGPNVLKWIIIRGTCPADSDNVTIVVGDVKMPTMITPNGDNKNEYFVVLGIESLGKTELIVFDRRGAEVFRNSEYDNKWNGVDYNENPLANDTYFYLLKAPKRTLSGYIVIRR